MQEKQTIKKLKQALLASEAKYRELFEDANIGIFQSTLDGKVISVNPAFAQMFGYESPEDVLANVKNVATDVFADPQRRNEIIRLQAENPDLNTFENIYRRKDGSLFTGLLNVRHVNVVDGQPNFWGFIQDITDHKQSVEKLRQSEQRFQSLIEKAADLIAVINAEGVIQFASPPLEKMLGYKPEEVVGRNFLEWVHPDDLPGIQRALASRSRTPGTAPASLIIHIRHKNGEWRTLEALGTNLLAEPAIQGIVLNIRDVTEREQAEHTIELKDELLHMTGVMAKVGGWEFDAETRRGTWTDDVARIHDFDPGNEDNFEVWLSFYTGESREKIEKAVEEALVLARPYVLELEMTSAKGVHKWIRTMGLPIMDADQVVKVRGIFQDITERKRIEEALRESEEKWRAIVDSSPDFIALHDPQGKYLFLNHYARGFSEKDAIGHSVYEFVAPESREIFKQNLEICLKSMTIQKFEHRALGDNGEIRTYDEFFIPLLKKNNEVNIMAVARDVTEQKKAEEVLKKRNAEISLLYEASQALSRTLNLDELYLEMNRLITRVMPCDGLFISGYEQQTGLIRCVYAIDEHQQALDVSNFPPIPLEPEGRGTQSQVIRSGKPLLLNDYQAQMRTARASYYVNDDGQLVDVDSIPADADVTRSALILPILLEGQVVGVLQVFSYRLNAYSQDDLKIAEALAAQFSAASNNALLYQQAQLEIAERKQTEKRINESEARYRSLFEYTPIALLEEDFSGAKQILDALKRKGVKDFETYLAVHPEVVTGCAAQIKVTDVNRAALELFKAGKKENLTTDLSRVLDENSIEYFIIELVSIASGLTKFEWEGINKTLTGELIYVNLNWLAAPGYEESLSKVIVSLVNITERKHAEDALRRQNAYLAALQETMLELISLHDLNTLLENIVRRACQLAGTEAGYLGLVEPGATQLKMQIGLGALAEALKFATKPGEGVAGMAWKTGKMLVIDDYDAWEGRIKNFSRQTIRSVIGIPLLSEDKVVGILGLAYAYPSNQTFGAETIEQLTQFAHLATLAIENARVFAALQQELADRKQAEAALRKSEASIRSIYRSMDEMLALHELVYDPSGKAIDYRILDCNAAFNAITGIPQEQAIGKLASQLYGTGEAPFLEAYARVAETGETIHFETAFAPMKKHFSISAFSPEKGHFATISSDITRRKAADAEINRHLSELEVLYENGLAISQLLEPKQIGQKLIETLSQKLDWYHAAIRAFQPETGKLTLLAYSHPGFNNAEIEEEITRLNQLITDSGKGLSGWVIKHGKPVRCAQVKKNKHYIEAYPGIQSGLYVPIRAGGRTIGSIAVESEQEDAFSEQDLRLLTTIASQAAISIQNAQLFLMAQQELAARKQAEQALLEAQAELEHRVVEATAEVQDLYNNAPCGYHSLDAQGKFVHINKTELDWLGYESEEIIGHPVKDFMSESSQALFAELFPVFKKDGVFKDVEFEFVRRDGSLLPLLVNATAIFDENGGYKMSRSTCLDITRRKLIEAALRESESGLRQNRDELSAANIALEKAARMKDEFLASMSHELRTPLTGILGLSEALQLSTYGELSEKQLKALKNIESSGRHLLDLINDILDLSKIEAGKFEVHIEQCSLADICRASLQLARGMAQQKHQEVSFSMNPDSIYLHADARRLKQMLVNLLSNAVKFTPDGGSIGLEVLGNEGEQQVRLTVWDTGIGIKAEDLKNLFKPFVQLDSSLSRQYSGTGLGLSLVQRMAELQGGSVKFESAPTGGSRFTIILPWAVRDEQATLPTLKKTAATIATQPAPLKETGQGDHPALILVADDNEDILGMLSDFLEVELFHVIKTRSGKELLERIPELHPDLVLVDIQMPGIDGLETIRRIRAHPHALVAGVPIIAITALAMPGDRERCLASGANEYLSKPLELVKLITIIQELLHR